MNPAHALASTARANVGELLSGLPEGLRARVGRAREVDARRRETEHGEPLATALAPLDLLLEGGLPRGQLVELVGARSSGRFSTVLALLAAATTAGEAAALIDLGDGFAPAEGVTAGIELERLLWLRPTDLKAALAATEMAIGGGFPLVVLDLGPPPVRGRSQGEGAWLRLARAAQAQGTSLLVAAPYRVSGPAAATVLRAAHAPVAWRGEEGAPRVLEGVAVRLVLEKQRGRLGGVCEGRAEGMRLAVADLPAPEARRAFPLRRSRHLRQVPAPAPPAARREETSVPLGPSATVLLPLRRAVSA